MGRKNLEQEIEDLKHEIAMLKVRMRSIEKSIKKPKPKECWEQMTIIDLIAN